MPIPTTRPLTSSPARQPTTNKPNLATTVTLRERPATLDQTVQTPKNGAGTRSGTRRVRDATDKDQELLDLVVRYRAVTFLQIATAMSITVSGAGRRARRLIDLGLLEFSPLTVNGYCWVGATKSGYELATGERTTPRWTLSLLPHIWLVAETGIALETTGHALVTDQQINTTLGAPGQGTAETTLAVRGDGITHTPDLLLAMPDSEHAIECQISRKKQREFERILTLYKRDPNITHVLYRVTTQALVDLITAAAKATGTTEICTIELVDLRDTPFAGLLGRTRGIDRIRNRRGAAADLEQARRRDSFDGRKPVRNS